MSERLPPSPESPTHDRIVGDCFFHLAQSQGYFRDREILRAIGTNLESNLSESELSRVSDHEQVAARSKAAGESREKLAKKLDVDAEVVDDLSTGVMSLYHHFVYNDDFIHRKNIYRYRNFLEPSSDEYLNLLKLLADVFGESFRAYADYTHADGAMRFKIISIKPGTSVTELEEQLLA